MLTAGIYSDTHRRFADPNAVNQDAGLAFTLQLDGEPAGVIGVCDGLGGEGGGDTASRHVVKAIFERLLQPIDSVAVLEARLDRAFIKGLHHDLLALHQSGSGHKPMTTLTLAIVTPNGARYASLGDSRIYRAFGPCWPNVGRLQLMTRDGTPKGTDFNEAASTGGVAWPIGGEYGDPSTVWTWSCLEIRPGDTVFCTSDGLYSDFSAAFIDLFAAHAGLVCRTAQEFAKTLVVNCHRARRGIRGGKLQLTGLHDDTTVAAVSVGSPRSLGRDWPVWERYWHGICDIDTDEPAGQIRRLLNGSVPAGMLRETLNGPWLKVGGDGPGAFLEQYLPRRQTVSMSFACEAYLRENGADKPAHFRSRRDHVRLRPQVSISAEEILPFLTEDGRGWVYLPPGQKETIDVGAEPVRIRLGGAILQIGSGETPTEAPLEAEARDFLRKAVFMRIKAVPLDLGFDQDFAAWGFADGVEPHEIVKALQVGNAWASQAEDKAADCHCWGFGLRPDGWRSLGNPVENDTVSTFEEFLGCKLPGDSRLRGCGVLTRSTDSDRQDWLLDPVSGEILPYRRTPSRTLADIHSPVLHIDNLPETGKTIRVGRSGWDPAPDIALDHDSVSPDHLEIAIGSDGSLVANDLGSDNGTWVWKSPRSGDIVLILPDLAVEYRDDPAAPLPENDEKAQGETIALAPVGSTLSEGGTVSDHGEVDPVAAEEGQDDQNNETPSVKKADTSAADLDASSGGDETGGKAVPADMQPAVSSDGKDSPEETRPESSILE